MSEEPHPAVRNIGIIAHIDAGKTTLTEQFLAFGGVISRPGSVEDGSTVADWMDAEQRRGITIASAAVTCQWAGCSINLIDTPGHVDFTWEVERCLRVLDGAVMVLSGPDGVQAQTQTVWHQAMSQCLPVIGLMNKLDREGYDHERVLDEIQERLGIEPVPLFVPITTGPAEVSIIDILGDRRLTWRDLGKRRGRPRGEVAPLDEEAQAQRHLALEVLADAVASFDDELTEHLLADQEPARSLWIRALQRAVAAQACLPLLGGAARAGAGVEEVMQAVVDLLPSPRTARPIPLFDLDTGERLTSWPATLDDSLLAYVFKTESRTGGRRVAYVRVYSGTLLEGTPLVRQPSGTDFSPTGIVALLGGWEDPVPGLPPGSVGGMLVAPGAELPAAGETLLLPGHRLSFEPPRPPDPVITVSVEAPRVEDHRNMIEALEEITFHDPSLILTTDRDSGRTLVGGMGELHLEVALERLQQATGLQCGVGTLRPRYRTCLLSACTGRGQFKQDTDPAAWVEIEIELHPVRWDHPPSLDIDPPTVTRQDWRAALLAGLEQVLVHERELSGVEVRLLDVNWKGGGVLPGAFWQASSRAVREALAHASLVSMEPWVHLTIVVPNDRMGAVIGDLGRRRARVRSTSSRGDVQLLEAEAPLVEVIRYATGLRSLTGGIGSFTQAPLDYRPITPP